MEVGDSVVFEDPFSETLYGVIISKIVPRCKCKGIGEWVVDFGGVEKRVKIDDKRLRLNKIEPQKGSMGFNFK